MAFANRVNVWNFSRNLGRTLRTRSHFIFSSAIYIRRDFKHFFLFLPRRAAKSVVIVWYPRGLVFYMHTYSAGFFLAPQSDTFYASLTKIHYTLPVYRACTYRCFCNAKILRPQSCERTIFFSTRK